MRFAFVFNAVAVVGLSLALLAPAAARAGLAEAADQCNTKGPHCEPHKDKGYVIIKDYCGATQFLLVASVPMSGIESPGAATGKAGNYFKAAWDFGYTHFDGRDIMLGLNSPHGRRDSRLHIHIDLIRDGLRGELDKIGPAGETGKMLHGHTYDIARVTLPANGGPAWNLVGALANKVGAAAMERQSLALTGNGSGKYFVLNGHVEFANDPKLPPLDNGNTDSLEWADHGVPHKPGTQCFANDE